MPKLSSREKVVQGPCDLGDSDGKYFSVGALYKLIESEKDNLDIVGGAGTAGPYSCPLVHFSAAPEALIRGTSWAQLGGVSATKR